MKKSQTWVDQPSNDPAKSTSEAALGQTTQVGLRKLKAL